jgi:hypothetical protein
MALAFFDHLLCEGAEESFDVRFAHEEIECDLDDGRLHVRGALRAAALARFAKQRGAQDFRILRREFRRLAVRAFTSRIIHVVPLLKLSASLTGDPSDFRDVLMADLRIVQKDEIVIGRLMWRGITHKRDV